MIRCQPIIGATDVEQSSKWYQQLLDCQGLHGGAEFEMLSDADGHVFLCLHRWSLHEHPTLSGEGPRDGRGLILYLHVGDLDAAWERALSMGVTVEEPPHENPNAHVRQFCIRDPDGYYLIISLAQAHFVG